MEIPAEMKDALRLITVMMLFCVSLAGRDGLTTTSSSSDCTVNAVIIPSSGIANHAAARPENQVHFSAVADYVGGLCPHIVVTGSWITSDTVNTTISNEPSTPGLATCLNATPGPATINYTGAFYGRPYEPAMLSCE